MHTHGRMNVAHTELNTEERATARTLWQALTTAQTKEEREQAQQQLTDTEPHIQQAMINAIVQAIREQRSIQPHENPFD